MTSAGAAGGDDAPTLATYLPGPAILMQGPCTTALLAVRADDPAVRACWYAVLAADPLPQVLELLATSSVADHVVLDRRHGGRLHGAGRLSGWVHRTATDGGTWARPAAGPLTGVDAVLLCVVEPTSSPRLPLLTGIVHAAAVHVPLTWEGVDSAPEDLGGLGAPQPKPPEPEPPEPEPPEPEVPERVPTLPFPVPPPPPAPPAPPALLPPPVAPAPGAVAQPDRTWAPSTGFIERVPDPVASASSAAETGLAPGFITQAPPPSRDDR